MIGRRGRILKKALVKAGIRAENAVRGRGIAAAVAGIAVYLLSTPIAA